MRLIGPGMNGSPPLSPTMLCTIALPDDVESGGAINSLIVPLVLTENRCPLFRDMLMMAAPAAGADARRACAEETMPAAREDSGPAWYEIVRTTLRANDVRLVVHVPDNVLKPLIAALDADDFFTVF